MPDTVGKKVVELSQKEPESRDPIEIQREMQKDYWDNLIECIEKDKARYIKDVFYVVVITKAERLLANTFRNFFFSTHDCPTPDYDQTVFSIHKKDQSIEYLWTIPNREAAFLLLHNASIVHPEERRLRDYVVMLDNGKLLEMAKKRNGEKELDTSLESQTNKQSKEMKSILKGLEN